MPLTDAKIRAIANLLSDPLQAHAASSLLATEAKERGVLVADLIASALAPPAQVPPPAPPAPEPELTDSIDVAIGKRIDHGHYGLQSEIRCETEKAWLVRSPVGGPDVWLPKSQAQHEGYDAAGRAILILTSWIAREKGFI
jgi:hypothetical protein